MIDIHYKLKDQGISTLELAVWVRKRMPKYGTQDAIIIARKLKKGDRWSPPIDEVHEYRDAGPCSFETTPDPQNHWEIYETKRRAICDLGNRGADGDVEAAVEFCKMFKAGELNFLGAAYA